MKKLKRKVLLIYFFGGSLSMLCELSCSNPSNNSQKSSENQAGYSPPVVVLLDTVPPPEIIELKNARPPSVITVPNSTSETKYVQVENSRIKISPPKISNASAPDGHFTNFGMEDGLSHGWVETIMEDSKHRIWFGTLGGGADCYDGSSFTNYNVNIGLSGPIFSMAEDKIGNIWFGVQGAGVSRYDGFKFINYDTRDGLANNTVFDMTLDEKGNLWISTLGGVSRFDGKKFITIDTADGLPNNNVNMVRTDSKGNLWFITFGGGICKYDGNRLQTYTTADGLPTNFMLSVFEDSKKILWFGSYQGGISRFDGNHFTTFTKKDGLPDNTVNEITEDKDGDLWLATDGGIARIQGTQVSSFTKEQGLAGNAVRTVARDHSGYLWFGTDSYGASRYNGKALSMLSAKQGLQSNLIQDIGEDKAGNIWMGIYENGLTRYDGQKFTTFSTEQGLLSYEPGGIIVDQHGDLWLGSKTGGITHFDGKTFTSYGTKQGLVDNGVFNIMEDTKGNIWVATLGGVSHFDGKTFTNYTTKQGLSENFVLKIVEDKKGRFWIGTRNSGISCFDGKSFTNFGLGQGLGNDPVIDLKVDRNGNLWIATQGGGVSRYDGKSFLKFTSGSGSPDNSAWSISEDDDGVIWIGTTQGLCSLHFRIPGTENKPGEIKGAGLLAEKNDQLKFYEPVWEVFNLKTGFPIKDIVDRSFMISRRGPKSAILEGAGIIWALCGDAKVIRFDPRTVLRNQKPLSPFIQSVRIDEESISWHSLGKKRRDSTLLNQQESRIYGKILSNAARDSLHNEFGDLQFEGVLPFYQVPAKLVLPYRHNRVSFDYGAVQTSKYMMVRYQYMLEGLDSKWSPITDKRSVGYDNLHEGSYTFLLKARSPEGLWSEPVKYSFRILAPWWRTWWAYTSYMSVLLFVIYIIVRWRTRTLQIEKRHLEGKVQERTAQLEHKSVALENSLKELKSTQSQLIQSAKMASLGELTAGIAHEIQNPLNFVNNFSDVNNELIDELKAELATGNTQLASEIANDIKENGEKINHHGKRADSIVKGMLQHSRTSTGQKELSDINKLVDEYLQLAYHGFRGKDKSFNAETKTNLDPSVGKINIIPQDIGRVILNLINNAFYAVNEKVKLQSALRGYEPLVTISTKKLNDKIDIRVKDNGNGIPQKIVDKIFQPFFTTKPTGQGTGLGLSLAYDIVKAHGGEIKVESEEGLGSEFIVRLPASPSIP